jgi:hypothetical protein
MGTPPVENLSRRLQRAQEVQQILLLLWREFMEVMNDAIGL